MTEVVSREERRERVKSEGKARTMLRVAAVSAALGILLAVSGDAAIARWFMLLGLLLLVLGLHRFGRLGADPALPETD